MSFQLLSETKPKARKPYACIWCTEKIQVGEVHIHQASKYDGDFQDHRWHPECWSAAVKDFKESGEEDFPANAFKRGTNAEA